MVFVRIFVSLAAFSIAWGQTGELSGIVRDSSQAAVSGATVTVRNENGFLTRAQGADVAHSKTDNRKAKTTQKGESL